MRRIRNSRTVAWMVASAFVLIAGCKKDSGQVRSNSTIEIDPPQLAVEIDSSILLEYPVVIRNTGQGKVLNLQEILLDYSPATEAEAAGQPAFELEHPALPAEVHPQGEGTGPETFTFVVRFHPQGDNLQRTATITIFNDNDTEASRRELKIVFSTRACDPTLQVPATVDFLLVTMDQGSRTEEFQLTNVGSCRLIIDWVALVGDDVFEVDLGGGVLLRPMEPGQKLDLNPPLEIDSNTGITWTSTFSPKDGEPARATLTLHTNEADLPDGLREVALVGNSTGPRIRVEPPEVQFGGKVIGRSAAVDVVVRSVGTEPLVLTGIGMKTPDSSPDFSLRYDSLPGQVAPSPESPLELQPNDTATFTVVFTPDVKNPVVNGVPDPDTGLVLIQSNAFNPVTQVPVTGFGVEVECPMPVIQIEEGEEVRPQTRLHLHGENSEPASGSITRYSWTVEQPPDNKFAFVPAANFDQPIHEVNVGGTYKYCLDVCDAQFCSSDPQCNTTACVEVTVVPDQAIHCELTWDTPGDPDQFDDGEDAGADMDLHFAHPFASRSDLDGDGKPDPWFDIPYDCFWYNRNPEWESVNPNIPDNPSLDRDDTDGAGPENLNLDQPANNRVYRVGVHYWDDHGFGFSYPRLKCYILGQLVFDRDLKAMGRKMYKCDFWEAATISWPSGRVEAVQKPDGSLKITSNYMDPAFVVVGGGSCGQP